MNRPSEDKRDGSHYGPVPVIGLVLLYVVVVGVIIAAFL